jgi:[ribosomal protein S5]-alanine N-acetyltransferase
MPPFLQTARLLLRHYTLEDVAAFCALNADWEVVKYTGNSPFEREEEAKKTLETLVFSQYTLYNAGRWAVFLKEDNTHLGWCGLKYNVESEEWDLGYRFFRRYWGYGYATEAARFCLDYGFSTLDLDTIIAKTQAPNNASSKVLEKLGMYQVATLEANGKKWLKYAIRNPKLNVVPDKISFIIN